MQDQLATEMYQLVARQSDLNQFLLTVSVTRVYSAVSIACRDWMVPTPVTAVQHFGKLSCQCLSQKMYRSKQATNVPTLQIFNLVIACI